MANSEKINKKKLLTNCQKIDNSFLSIFINDFVKKLRLYNNDDFLIVISGLKNVY